VFDPYSTSEELLGYNYSDTYIDTVICAKKFLSYTYSRFMNPIVDSTVSTPSDFDLSWEAFYEEDAEKDE
jgi:hypothetical protein